MGAFKVRRPGLIPQADIKRCGPLGSARAGGHQGQGFVEPWPTSGAPKGLQVGSHRPTLRRAPRGASSPTPTATPPEVSKQAGSDWLEQPSRDTGPSGCERCAGWPPLHPRESLYPIAPLSFYDAMNGGGVLSEYKKERKKVKSLTHVQLLVTPWTIAHTRLLYSWDSPGKTTGVGYHFLLQGIFLTQGSNLGLPHFRQTLYYLSHQGSP